MKIQSNITTNPLLTYQELQTETLYIMRDAGWANGLLFYPNKDWQKPDVIRGVVFTEDRIAFITWADCPDTRFELAPSETTITITQG